MTLLMLVNLGLAGSGVVGAAFKVEWAVNSNQIIGPAISQPVTK